MRPVLGTDQVEGPQLAPLPTTLARMADGPDEVHKILIAKNVLARAHGGHGWDFGS